MSWNPDFFPVKGEPVFAVRYSERGGIGVRYSAPYRTRQDAEGARARLAESLKDRIFSDSVEEMTYESYKRVGPYYIVSRL